MSAHLPPTRIKTIMKSSAEVEVVSLESLLLVTRATVSKTPHRILTFNH